MHDQGDDGMWHDEGIDRLERMSNLVIELLDRGHLDDAEAVCRELRRQFPDEIDWIERTALVLEARGDTVRAVEHFERCIAFVRQHPDGFDAESEAWYREKVRRLEARKR